MDARARVLPLTPPGALRGRDIWPRAMFYQVGPREEFSRL